METTKHIIDGSSAFLQQNESLQAHSLAEYENILCNVRVLELEGITCTGQYSVFYMH